jgi:hypothetical protein
MADVLAGEAGCFWGLARIAQVQGHHGEAVALYRQALGSYHEARALAHDARAPIGRNRASSTDTAMMAERLEAGFRRGVTDAISVPHGAGHPVSVLNDAGELVWLHPDGQEYATEEPVHVEQFA